MNDNKKKKVLYFLNYAPNYRDKFLRELGEHVDLTAVAYNGKEANLKDPENRKGYKFIELKRKQFLNLNFNFNLKEYTLANGNYDVIIVGYALWFPFRMINLFRHKKKVICAGKIYGKNNDFITKTLRRVFVNRGEGILAYSQKIAKELSKETKKPIIVFNNTSYYKSEIKPLPIPALNKKLHILWVGRYQKRKKLKFLYKLAEQDKRVQIRIIGPGVFEGFSDLKKLKNLEVLDAQYGNDLKRSFSWSHIIFNPGAVGLLVMNAARFQRSIVLGHDPFNGAETQLAIDANQDFIDFSNVNEVREYIDKIFENPDYMEIKAQDLCEEMHNYTIEHMVKQFMKAIEGDWSS